MKINKYVGNPILKPNPANAWENLCVLNPGVIYDEENERFVMLYRAAGQLNRDQRNFSIVMWLFIMTGIALVVYFNSSPGEPRERDYVYAGSFYAYSIWLGLGVLALREFFDWLTKGRQARAAAIAATVVAMGVPTLLAAENWDDHDRSGRYMARDIGWNYLQSTLPNSIILNYGDNDMVTPSIPPIFAP